MGDIFGFEVDEPEQATNENITDEQRAELHRLLSVTPDNVLRAAMGALADTYPLYVVDAVTDAALAEVARRIGL